VFQELSRLPVMEKLLPVIILVAFIIALLVEHRFPARPLPKVRGWLAKGLLFFAIAFVMNGAIPALIATAVGNHAPLDLSRLGTFGGAIAGFLLADLVGYGLHRTMHRVPFLWRWAHQMHHSAERMDLAGMTYSHPLDQATTFILTGLATALLGLSPEAGALAGLIGFFTAVIQHSNIRTPVWLGYITQRPEGHAVHHQRGVHAYNYGSFPLWDILGGTWRNPVGFPAEYGFWDGASKRVGAMLLGRNVGDGERA
jgi:sterol desaturase/sphingolipid hydroxylase (fatty acid hydroxylase superfamily)